MRALILSGLLLAGCASGPAPLPRYYVNYKAVIMEEIDHAFMGGPHATAPGPVKLAYASCGADAILAQYTSQQRATLDAYARREIVLTGQQLADINAATRERFGYLKAPDQMYEVMAPFCPNDIPAFRAYLS